MKIGRVEAMGLADDRARLQLRLQDGVKLQEDAIASVRARGLIGDKFVLITPGASDKIIPLAEGSEKPNHRRIFRT